MGLQGASNFIAGETRKSRVYGEGAVLDRCNGYDPTDGSLKPENVVEIVSTDNLDGTTPDQIPVTFRDGSTVSVFCRDANEAVRSVTDGGAWSEAGDTIDILSGSSPVKMGKQIIFPTDGYDGKLMVYEPGSSSTKLRPLSLKSPYDYVKNEKPTVTATTNTAVQLFDNDYITADWQNPGTGCTCSTDTDADSATLTLDSTSLASDLCFTKNLETGIDLTGKMYLVLDMAIIDDPQDYTDVGMFINNPTMSPSGYLISLYKNTDYASGNLIDEFHIPRLAISGKVYRVVLSIAGMTDTVVGVGIKTASFYERPKTSDEDPDGIYPDAFSVVLYSEAFASDGSWKHKGNFLMPELKYYQSPLYKTLTDTSNDVQVSLSKPTGTNQVSNPSFETDDSSWTFHESWCARRDTIRAGAGPARTGSWFGYIPNNTSAYFDQDNIPLTAGVTYEMSYYQASVADDTTYMTLQPKDSGGGNIGPVIRLPEESGSANAGIGEGVYKKFSRQFPCPSGATKCTIEIHLASGTAAHDTAIDDVAVTPVDETEPNKAWILQSWYDDTTLAPEMPVVEYAYCFAGKNLLGEDSYSLMVSNPSDPNDGNSANAYVYCDPWRTYDIDITLPTGGAIQSISINNGGTGYSVDDVLTISGGSGGTATVTSVDGGVVDGISLTTAGTGYSSATAADTSGGSGNADCTLDVIGSTVIDEYSDDYVTDVLIYRRIYTGGEDGYGTGTWGSWEFIKKVIITSSISENDYGGDVDERDEPDWGAYDTDAGIYVPEEMEITNDYASSARYVTFMGGRVFAGCLDWDEDEGKWKRPTAIEISSYQKPWAFPTTVDDDSLVTDGTELDGYAVTGSEIRGMIARQDELYVFLDNEFFLVRGTDPVSGYSIIRLDSVGCCSGSSIADCRKAIIWHDGNDFYGYAGGSAEPISRNTIDSSLIDWTKAHNAVYYRDKYIFYCYYDSGYALLIFDTITGSWRIRRSTALNLVGICTDGNQVFGVTTGGNAVDVFGSSTAEGIDGETPTQSPTRNLYTQYFVVGAPNADVQVNEAVLLIETQETSGVTVVASFSTLGTVDNTATAYIYPVAQQTRYRVPLNLICNSIKVQLTYIGTTPPVIYDIYFVTDEAGIQ